MAGSKQASGPAGRNERAVAGTNVPVEQIVQSFRTSSGSFAGCHGPGCLESLRDSTEDVDRRRPSTLRRHAYERYSVDSMAVFDSGWSRHRVDRIAGRASGFPSARRRTRAEGRFVCFRTFVLCTAARSAVA